MKIKIEHSDRNATEYGYGLYINGVSTVLNAIFASECISKTATDEQIKQAEKRVRAKALRKLNSY